jgi:hypothetical protein
MEPIFTSKKIEKILFILILIFPILLLFQGGDLTDEGSNALTYQNFYYNLQNNVTFSYSILSDFIGATWLYFFPDLGILGLKFLYLIFYYLIITLIYLVLREVTKNKLLLLFGIFCGVLFSERFTHFGFDRDTASWFFLMLTSFFIIKGLNKRKDIYFFFSGLIYIFACFSRFPDIVFIALLPLVLVYNHNYRVFSFRQISIPIKRFLLFIFGTTTSLIITMILFKYLDIYDVFISNLDFIKKSIDISNPSSHSLFNLLKRYFIEGLIFIPHLILIFSLIIIASLIFKYSNANKRYYIFSLFAILVFCTAFIFYRGFHAGSNIKYLVSAFCLFPLLFSIREKDKFSTLVVLFSAISLTQLAGSNTGLFLKLNKGFMVLIPIAIFILYERKEVVFMNTKIYTKPVLNIGISIILFLSAYLRVGTIYHVDRGIGSRLRAVYPIEHEKMRGIFTTKMKAKHIKALTNSIKRNLENQNNLFIYGHQPMFYFLTETIPQVENYWLVDNIVQVEELFSSLEESIKLKQKYPMIVDTKQNVMGESGQLKLEEFLKKYNYSCIERKENYNIWKK